MSLYESFYCSTCFGCYYIHPQKLVNVCGCTVWVCTGVLVRFGRSRVVSECRNVECAPTCIRIPPYSSRTASIHQYTPKQYTHIQSPAPEDECNNIRNMLSNKKTFIKWHQVGSIYSTSKMMHSPTNIRYTVFLYTFWSTGIFIMQNAFMHKAIPWQILCSVTQ